VAASPPIPKLRTLLWRGWRKKCPQCGEGEIYQRWLKLREQCPECGLQYLPNQGDLWGPLLFLDRVLFIIPIIALFYFRIWHPNQFLFYLFGGIMIFVLVYTMPNRNGMSLAVDYLLRRKGGDLYEETPPKEK
jgi:uncharacterized protein (DUF983 family)